MARGSSLFGHAVAGLWFVAACGHDWDSLDPRLGDPPDAGTTSSTAGPGSGGAATSGPGVSSSTSTGTGTGTGTGGAGGAGGGIGGCGDLQTDGQNCGSCGHDCLGGECKSGICQPQTLAMGGAMIGVVVTATDIYWADKTAGVITVAAKDGSNPSPFAQQAGVKYLATDGMNLFWTTATTIRKRPLGGGPITDLVTGTNIEGIAVLGNQIYFTAFDQGFFEAPKSGGTPTPIDVGNVAFAEGVTTWNGVVYWCDNGPANMNNGTITAYEIATASSMPWLTGEAVPAGIYIHNAVVYWTNQGTGELRSRDLSGDVTQTLVTGLDVPTGVAVDGAAIYWAEAGSGLVRRLAR